MAANWCTDVLLQKRWRDHHHSIMLDSFPVKRDLEDEISNLFIDLQVALEKTKLAKAQRKTYKITTSKGDEEVDSWKFNEYAYSDKSIVLPLRARGVFTKDGSIIARGYDKFFSVDEVEDTKKDAIMKLKGPFEVTTKENGCIVLISGLEDGTLVVCSKHVTGEPIGESPNRESNIKHSRQAEKAVFEHLEKAGKKPEELAKVLYDHNVTAVAELCDDEFEEHIVEYPKELAGLYLHGINANIRDFYTYPMEDVFELADEFGFRKVHLERFDSIEELWELLEERSKSGSYQGRLVEGFVVRGKKELGDPFFFKYKFTRPYDLYRTLREATKKLVEQTEAKMDIALGEKKYALVVKAYLDFVEEYFEKNPEAAQEFLNDKGIIKARNLFLENSEIVTESGLSLNELEATELLVERLEAFHIETAKKYILVPIAVVGSGKTTVFRTLQNLFPQWGHVQNDNYQTPKPFREECIDSLLKLTVLLLDRNNAMKRERREIIDQLKKMRLGKILPDFGFRFIGVNFGAAQKSPEFEKIVSERVMKRGDEHQSIKASSQEARTSRIVSDLVRRLEQPNLKNKSESKDGEIVPLYEQDELAFPDDKFHEVINVDITKHDSLEIAKQIWKYLKDVPELEEERNPTEEEWQAAYKEALEYKPTFQKKMPVNSHNGKRAEYYGIHIEEREALVELLKKSLPDNPTWESIQTNGRVQDEFHVTLGHKDSIYVHEQKKPDWEALGRQFGMNQARKNSGEDKKVSVNYFYDIRLTRAIIFDDKLVTIEVKLEQGYKTDENNNIVKERSQIKPLNEHLHITIGTVSPAIRAAELNAALTELFLKYEDPEDGEYKLKETTARVVSLDKVLEKQKVFIMFTYDF